MRIKKITLSLVTRLLLLATLFAVVATVAGYVQITGILRASLTQVVSVQQIALAEYVARDIDEKLVEQRTFVERLAITLPPAHLSQSASLREWLAERQALQPFFSVGLVVADAKGTILAGSAPHWGGVGASIAELPVFRAARDGQSLIGRPVASGGTYPMSLSMASPIRNRAGQVQAVLLGTTDLSADGFLHRLMEGRIGHGGGLLLVSPQDKLFVGATDHGMLFKPTPPVGVNLLHDRAMDGFRGSGLTTNAKGVEEISAMASVPSTGWFVVARVPATEGLALVSQVQSFIIERNLLIRLLTIVLFGLMMAWLLRPLFRSAALADRMTQGVTPLAPLPVVRDDEIGLLTAAFNRLLAKLANQQVELERLAHHDALTGLPNRKLLVDRIQQALARARRNGTQVVVLFMDLNGFKQVNDTLGHEAGDAVLQEISRRLLMTVRQADTLARLGGDEFVLLMSDQVAPVERDIFTLAQKCIDAVAQPMLLRGSEHRFSVSVGIAVQGGEGSTESVLAAADKAMYQAKQMGRGHYALAAMPQAAASSP